MTQITFVEKKLDKKAKREVTKILRSYGNLDAIIQSMSVDMPKITQSPEPNESQRDNQFYSTTEDTAIQRVMLEEKKAIKEKLDIIYESINQEKRMIWNYRFIEGYSDEHAMIEMHLTSNRNKYFGEKYELMGMIADSFYLW